MQFFKDLVKQADQFLVVYNSPLPEYQKEITLTDVWAGNFELMYACIDFNPEDTIIGLDGVHALVTESYQTWLELSEVGDE